MKMCSAETNNTNIIRQLCLIKILAKLSGAVRCMVVNEVGNS